MPPRGGNPARQTKEKGYYDDDPFYFWSHKERLV
jgi:hypothetical protein